MTTHRDSRIFLAPAERIFDMVADVERYPDFLPLWREARIYERRTNVYWTEQTVGLGPVRESFRTKTTLQKPLRIEIVSTDDLFANFFISWDFHPVGRGCRASIALVWEMRSQKMQRAIDLLLSQAARSMVVAFEKRARDLRL
jgi:coenzyme Q-binding protein COQ10